MANNDIILKDNEIAIKESWIVSISYKKDVDIIYTFKSTFVVKKNSKERINDIYVKYTLADKK